MPLDSWVTPVLHDLGGRKSQASAGTDQEKLCVKEQTQTYRGKFHQQDHEEETASENFWKLKMLVNKRVFSTLLIPTYSFTQKGLVVSPQPSKQS